MPHYDIPLIAKENGLHYYNPNNNSLLRILGKMKTGTHIFSSVAVLPNPEEICIDFLTGDNPEEAELFLRYRITFKERKICVDCSEGLEKGGEAFPFAPSTNFLICVRAGVHNFELLINNEKLSTYIFRSKGAYEGVNFVRISGDVNIFSLHILLTPFEKYLHTIGIPVPAQIGDLYSFWAIPPSKISTRDYERHCAINFYGPKVQNPCTGNHLVEFTTVRSDLLRFLKCSRGDWPIASGQRFVMHIVIEPDNYRCWIDGKEWCTYDHVRPLDLMKEIRLVGGFTLERFVMDRPNCHLPIEFEGKETCDIARKEVMVLFPAIPLRMKLPNGFAPRKCISVTGIIEKNVKRFTVSLTCGASADPENVVYHYVVVFDDIKNLVIQSERRVAWGKEICQERDFPFVPGAPFQLQLYSDKSGEFTVTVDGVTNVRFRSHLHCSEADHLRIQGGVKIHRILVMNY